jgi:ubiquinone/menaquinone biosynthesis C-methylase UbiE
MYPRATGLTAPGVGATLVPMQIPGYRRVFAWVLARSNTAYEQWMAERKRRLLGALSGLVVEIGPGAGNNLRYLRPEAHWIGVEPNRYLRPYLEASARRSGVPLELRDGTAERLPFAAGSADAVITTLVLCSVDDPAAVLREIRRVLRPGGRFVFIEHVAAPAGTTRRRLQRWLKPLWQVVGDGCHPDRDTLTAIERAGFTRVEAEEFLAPAGLAAPHIAGVAIEPGAVA